MDKKLLTYKDMAQLFGLNFRTFMVWKTRHEDFPKPFSTVVIRGGVANLFKREDVLAYAERRDLWNYKYIPKGSRRGRVAEVQKHSSQAENLKLSKQFLARR